MARRENWFKHDIDSRLGLKMSAFLSDFGAEGYGIFWIIVETLYRTEGHRLAKDSKTYHVLENCSKSKLALAVIEKAIELGLFEASKDWFWSPRVLEELGKQAEHYQDIKAKRIAAGQLGGLAKASKASQIRSDQSRLDNKNNISLPVRDLAEREEPGSKIEEDPLLEIAKSKLVEPNGSQDWESKNPYMLAGRQPLKKFPEVCLSATELRDVIALYDQSSIEHLLGNAFKAAVGRLKQMQMDGKDTARAPCYSWLIGWAYQEQLENHNKTLRIERTQKPYER